MASFAENCVLLLLRGYKGAISPLLRPACRYVPTCSEYAMEAVARHGVINGGAKAIWRLLRCHPFSRGGFDPVIKSAVAGSEPMIAESHELCSH